MSCVTNTMVLCNSACSRSISRCSSTRTSRVDGRKGLVHQQNRRIGGQRARHTDPLLLAAGQLRGIASGQLRIQAHSLQHGVGGLACRAPRLAFEHRHRRDVVDHPLVRHQARALDHVADAEAQPHRVDAGDVGAVHDDGSRRRLGHPVDHPHRRRLAAPGRADEDGQRSPGHFQVQPVDGDSSIGVNLVDVMEADQLLNHRSDGRSRCHATSSGQPDPGRYRHCRPPKH